MNEYGPCPTCGEKFESRYRKKYCSMDCYLKSPELLSRLKLHNMKRKVGINQKCIECGKEFYVKKSRSEYARVKFCSQVCYRQYMQKRFDRWIASPEKLALPQNYDEFLTLQELPCLIDGCGWRGNFLSLHMNLAHGVRARDFKKMAGFNLKSGVISLPLYNLMCARPHIKNAKFKENTRPSIQDRDSYKSLEGKEHWRKTYTMLSTNTTRTIKCLECGADTPVSYCGHGKKFCSVDCRRKHYREHEKERINTILKCGTCLKDFDAGYSQVRRSKKGLPCFCSASCRQKYNARQRRER